MSYGVNQFLLLDKLRRRTTVHKAFIVLNGITEVTAIHLAAGQIWGLCIQKNNYPLEVAIRLYTIGFAALIFMNEAGLTRFTKDSPILQNFVCRGALYSFIGCVGKLANDIGSNNYEHWYGRDQYGRFTWEALAEMYILFITIVTVIIGILYVAMGALCFDRVLAREREDYRIRMNEWDRKGGRGMDEGRSCIDISSAVLA